MWSWVKTSVGGFVQKQIGVDIVDAVRVLSAWNLRAMKVNTYRLIGIKKEREKLLVVWARNGSAC